MQFNVFETEINKKNHIGIMKIFNGDIGTIEVTYRSEMSLLPIG